MKKKILGLATITLLLTACNNDENNSTPDNGAVRVEIGTSSPNVSAEISRASINDEDWEGTQNIGIFGIAKNAADWSVTTGNIYLLDNQRVSIGKEVDSYPIVFPQMTLYPMDNVYAYSFYGYHPIQGEENLVRGQNTVLCYFTLTGSEDILWGKAVHTDPEAYNGKFVRGNNEVPNITFKHLLTRFTFTIKDENISSGASALKINAIRLKEMKNKAILVITDRVSENISGMLFGTEGEATFVLNDIDGKPLVSRTIPGETTPIGESIMAIPGETSYTIEIELETETGETSIKSVEFEHPESNDQSKVEFEAGISHNINIKVYGPNEVKITSTLEPWEKHDTDIDISFD